MSKNKKQIRKPIKSTRSQQDKPRPPKGPAKKTKALKPPAPFKDPFELISGPIEEDFDVKDFSTNINIQEGFTNTINAVSLQQKDGKYFVEIAVSPEQRSTVEALLASHSIPPGNVTVATCNTLSFFAPETVHTKTFNGAGIDNSGTCGVFSKSGGTISVFSAGHVYDRANASMAVALPFKESSVAGKVTHHVAPGTLGVSGLGTIDLGIGKLNTQESLESFGIELFQTKLGRPNIGDRVRVFGATSEFQLGFITSINASPTIGGKRFHNLVQMDIISQPGDSGAAVVNDQDNIIGLIIGGDSDTINRRIYCSNLFRNKSLIPSQFRNKLYLHGTPTKGKVPHESTSPVTRRREVEAWLHRGTLTKVATPGEYGEIKMASAGSRDEDIQILTHYDHSFFNSNGGAELEGKKVYFFAIPMEYIVKREKLVGLSNQSPLVAVNVSRSKLSLLSIGGFQKVTPCGGGSTTQPSPTGTGGSMLVGVSAKPSVYMSAKTRVVAASKTLKRSSKKGRSRKTGYINHIINDYGQLILVKSIGEPIAPSHKIIGKGIPQHKDPPLGVPGIANARLYYGDFEDDTKWKWGKEKKR